jgi:hypothetical protein
MSVGTSIDLLSAIVVLLALVSGATTFASTRQLGIALAVLLDLLTAAGLLHLAADPTYMRAVSAAIVLGVRHLVSWSLSHTGQAATVQPHTSQPTSRRPASVSRRTAQFVHVLTMSPLQGFRADDPMRMFRPGGADDGVNDEHSEAP